MAYVINREACMCCHNCAMECPAGAIGYVGTSYQIDPELCLDCGLCAQVCNVGAASSGEAPETVPAAVQTLDCDLVVLGAGGAGLVAAVRAAELSGKKVVVLEKADKIGGSAWYAHGFMIMGSKMEQERGLRDERDDMIRRAMKMTQWKLDPQLVGNAVYATGEFFDWLCEKDPEAVKACFDFMPRPFGGEGVGFPHRKYFNLKCTDPAIGPGWMGSFVVKVMAEQCRKLGVEIRTGWRATELITDLSGAVTGVLAEGKQGKLRVACRACLLATGGWARNDDMLREHWPSFFAPGEPVHRFAVPTVTGDVVQLGESAGAKVDYDNFCVNVFGPVHHPFSYCLFRVAMQPEVINVNLDGRRWVDESDFTNGSHILSRQPGSISYAILDEGAMTALCERLIQNPPDGTDGWIFENYRAEIEEELALDTPLKRGDTLESLAEQCGMPAENLKATVARYNGLCAQGRDADFFKRPETMRPLVQPPYYAIYTKRATDGAFGGVLVDPHMRAYGKDGGVVPGLFAAGDNSSGWCLKQGDSKTSIVSDLTWAMASGYLAGKTIADTLMA